ncbi:MAG: glycoside hydrolase family 5 protein, partial [Lachnospiraceae bacterium]|nr:glycoside hydrolase family 5 protein [Lachnospiraceae bacterium]
MHKKYYGATIAMAIALCLGGCGEKEEASAADMEAVMETRETIESDEIITEDRNEAETVTDAEPTDTGEPEAKAIEIEIAQKELPESEALAFVKDMKIGWNLGNTFDAIDCNWLSDEMQYESSWCGAVTTKEMIDALKEAGFQTIRIPVSWHNHLTDDNHTISEVWINRVQEVVDYAIDDDMYVIINIHHDFSKEYIYPSSEYLEQSKSYVTDIWEQIAERFKDYDEHLIME